MNNTQQGILFVIDGSNNVGKTTQRILLTQALEAKGYKATSFKYPAYECEPTGPRLNAYIRENNPENLSPTEFQIVQAQNKRDFEPALIDALNSHDVVIAEMYIGTGLAFGMVDGLDKKWLINLLRDIRTPDIYVILDGKQFDTGKEARHYIENDPIRTDSVRQNYLALAAEFGWHVVNANRPHAEVTRDLLKLLSLEAP